MRALIVSFAVLAGCMTSPHGGTCQFQRANQCCDGLGCASEAGTLTVTVLDATSQQPVAGAITFTSPNYNGPMPATCTTTTSPCPSWQVDGASALGEGTHAITAAATGYSAITFQATLAGPTGCCGLGPPTTATVSLPPMI
jgi:hypothetical protein